MEIQDKRLKPRLDLYNTMKNITYKVPSFSIDLPLSLNNQKSFRLFYFNRSLGTSPKHNVNNGGDDVTSKVRSFYQ
ncbi:hypothetical protein HN51_022796 [Arachis hypogaea]